MFKSKNQKSSISLDINSTYVCTKGYSSKYAYMTQYDRRKFHLPGLITLEINWNRCKWVCKSQNGGPDITSRYGQIPLLFVHWFNESSSFWALSLYLTGILWVFVTSEVYLEVQITKKIGNFFPSLCFEIYQIAKKMHPF